MQDHVASAQQYFPTYKIDENRKDIALKEYEVSAKALEADQRSLTAASGIALFFSGTAITILGSSANLTSFQAFVTGLGTSAEFMITLIIVGVAALATRYFALLQRSAVYASRKMIVIRRMLGVDYGNVEMVLPTERLDGANEPFAIPMFPGWSSLQALPAYAVGACAAVAEALVFAAFRSSHEGRAIWFLGGQVLAGAGELTLLVGVVTMVLVLAAFRWQLFEDFETIRLYSAKILGLACAFPLKVRIGHVLYRLRLAIYEADRLKIKHLSLHQMLIEIEDRHFYSHSGNRLRSLLSAGVRYIKFRRTSGGSTILQQLARSNFLTSLSRPLVRKALEWMLAPWLDKILTKSDVLSAYLCSVRFERGVIGLPEALKYFWPRRSLSRTLTNAEKFILIERLSNVTSTYPAARIQSLVNTLIKRGVLVSGDAEVISREYQRLGKEGLIHLNGQLPAIKVI